MTAKAAIASLLAGLLFAATGWAQQPRPLNEQPMYGGAQKTAAMIEADRKLIADAERQGLSRAQASDQTVMAGWQLFTRQQDSATAMKRFNQAWLLDPDNGDAYHGMAILVIERDRDTAAADGLFKRAVAAKRHAPNVFVDYGRFLLMARRPRDAVAVLQQGVQAPGVSPDAQALLAMAFQESGDGPQACAAAKRVQPNAQAAIKRETDKLAANCR